MATPKREAKPAEGNKNLEYELTIKHKGKVLARKTLAVNDEILSYVREREFNMEHAITSKLVQPLVSEACANFSASQQ